MKKAKCIPGMDLNYIEVGSANEIGVAKNYLPKSTADRIRVAKYNAPEELLQAHPGADSIPDTEPFAYAGPDLCSRSICDISVYIDDCVPYCESTVDYVKIFPALMLMEFVVNANSLVGNEFRLIAFRKPID
ncbi:MAG: hypothetical protein IKD66_13415 [Solobacterium sp.]|nr:hypothetical protein [Solobacterium sp.]